MNRITNIIFAISIGAISTTAFAGNLVLTQEDADSIQEKYNDQTIMRGMFRGTIEANAAMIPSNSNDSSDTGGLNQVSISASEVGGSSISSDFKNNFLQNDAAGSMECSSDNIGAVRYNQDKEMFEKCTVSGWVAEESFGGSGASCFYKYADVRYGSYTDQFSLVNTKSPYDKITGLSRSSRKSIFTGKKRVRPVAGQVKEYKHGDQIRSSSSRTSCGTTTTTVTYTCLSGRIIYTDTKVTSSDGCG